MKPASCKAKGRTFQTTIANVIRATFGFSDRDVRPAIMGETGADMKLSTLAARAFPFAVECKKVEALNIWKAMSQCEANAKAEGLRPLLVFSRNRSQAYAVVPLSVFMEMAQSFAGEAGPLPLETGPLESVEEVRVSVT